jgi:hypothetical protein
MDLYSFLYHSTEFSFVFVLSCIILHGGEFVVVLSLRIKSLYPALKFDK